MHRFGQSARVFKVPKAVKGESSLQTHSTLTPPVTKSTVTWETREKKEVPENKLIKYLLMSQTPVIPTLRRRRKAMLVF